MTFKLLRGWEIGPRPGSKSRKIDHIKERIELEYINDQKLSEFISILSDFENTHIDAYVEYDGWDYQSLYLIGWREMNEKEKGLYNTELKRKKKEKIMAKESRDKKDLIELERIKKQHPEWFEFGKRVV